MKNDTQIQQEVLKEIHRAQVPTDAFGVEVHHGVVKLAGRVKDATLIKNAELAARRVPEVSQIVLDLGHGSR